MSLTDLFFDRGLDSMKRKYVGSILRWALGGLGFIVVGKVADDQIGQLSGALIALAPLLWSMYEKRTTREVLVTTLHVANTSENAMKARVADPTIPTPSVNTAPDVIPTLTLDEVERATRQGG